VKNNKVHSMVGHSVMNWLTMGFVFLFLFIAPFQRALFNGHSYSFEGPIYQTVFWSAIFLLLLAIYYYRHSKISTNWDLMSLLVLLIPLSYLISAIGAASWHSALKEVYIRFVWVVFFLVGAYLARKQNGMRMTLYAIIGSGYMLVIYGFMNWFGNAHFRDAILDGNRLSNVFQYPNTYAAYLIGLVMGSLVLIQSTKHRYIRVASSIMLIPVMLSFLLTMSRGAFIIFPIIVVVYLIFLPWIKQVLTIIYLGISIFASLAVFSFMTGIRSQVAEKFDVATSLKGWALWLVISILGSIIIHFIHKYASVKFANHTGWSDGFGWKRCIIPLLAIVVVTGLFFSILYTKTLQSQLPEEIRIRFENLSVEANSVFSRSAYIKDAGKIIKDHPLFGTGGGGWSVIYESYKSFPYTSREAHNFYLQYIVESGLFGFVILVSFISIALWKSIKSNLFEYKRRTSVENESQMFFLLYSISILLHCAIDFDMSFVYISSLLFLCLGAGVANTGRIINLNLSYKFFPILIAITSVAMLFSVTPKVLAHSEFDNAVTTAQKTGNYNEIKLHLDKAIQYDKYHPEYNLYKIGILLNLYQQTREDKYNMEALRLMNTIESKEPYNKILINYQVAFYQSQSQLDRAIEKLDFAIEKYPWDMQLIEKYMELNFLEGLEQNQRNLNENLYWSNVIKLFQHMEDNYAYLETLPNSKRYTNMYKITPTIGLRAGQIYYLSGNYDEATRILDNARSKYLEIEINKQIALWYLASLLKQGGNNQSLYNRLIELYPNIDKELQAILEL